MVDGLSIVQNNMPLFITSSPMEGLSISSSDVIYDGQISAAEDIKVGVGTAVGFGLSFVPGGPVVGFLVGMAGDLAVNVVGDAIIKAVTTDNGDTIIFANTEISMPDACALNEVDQYLEAYCTPDSGAATGVIHFSVTDGTYSNPETVTTP